MTGSGIAVLGLQWGDEGKGKIVDYLSESCAGVARFGGGSNAGHTIVRNGEKFILRLLPSGILHNDKLCFIGAGVVCDPEVLESEITELEKRGISTRGRLFIDYATHLVLPLHKLKDVYEDACRGNNALDTTKRGIGPAYADRASRIGIRVADLFDKEMIESRLKQLSIIYKEMDGSEGNEWMTDIAALYKYLIKYEPLLKRLVSDVGPKIMDMLNSGKQVLFEGAQGSLLDIDFGTYPYTTSSHTTIGGIFIGLGIPPSYLNSTVGVVKAYTTRVGHGPFPTEIQDDTATEIRIKGGEFGSVTGRPRRIGWLDMVSLKRIIRINGITKLAITKLDVLDGLDQINVCESYEIDGHRTPDIPANNPDFCKAQPIYTKIAGWSQQSRGAKKVDDLPKETRKYLDFIEEKTGVPIWLVSTGQSREDTIILE